MTFALTFSQHFDHPPPFDIPLGSIDEDVLIATNRGLVTDSLFEVLGPAEFGKIPPQPFLCAAIRGQPPTVTLFVMLIEGERYFYFREQVRDVFNAAASPETCYASLCRMYAIFKKRTEASFKLVYNQGTVTVNNKTLSK
jgi:hypothetical protein